MRRFTTTWAQTLGSLTIGAVLVTGCTPAHLDGSAAEEPAPTSQASAPADASPTPQTDATTSFLAWLEASRVPDVDAACAPLAPELVERMLAEMRGDGFSHVSTCEEMITLTAELYRSFDQSAEVNIDVQSETTEDAVLFVTYLASGDCGKVVMQRSVSDWIITEQTEECA